MHSIELVVEDHQRRLTAKVSVRLANNALLDNAELNVVVIILEPART
jgi:hypothetical protein